MLCATSNKALLLRNEDYPRLSPGDKLGLSEELTKSTSERSFVARVPGKLCEIPNTLGRED